MFKRAKWSVKWNFAIRSYLESIRTNIIYGQLWNFPRYFLNMSSWTVTSLMIASKSHSEKQIKRALAKKSKDVDVKESNNNSQLNQNQNYWSCSIYVQFWNICKSSAWSVQLRGNCKIILCWKIGLSVLFEPTCICMIGHDIKTSDTGNEYWSTCFWAIFSQEKCGSWHMYAAWYRSSTQTSLQTANIVEVHQNDSGLPAGQYVLPQHEHCSAKASGLGVPVASKWIKLKSDWAARDDGVLLAYGGLLLQDNVSVSFRCWEASSSHYSLCPSLYPHDTRLQGRNRCEG